MFLDINEMYFSAEINNSEIDETILENVKFTCLRFYHESLDQLISRFPLKDSDFEELQFLDPTVVKNKRIRYLGNITKMFPRLIDCDVQTIDNEWLAMRHIDFSGIPVVDVCKSWQKNCSMKTMDDVIQFAHLSHFQFQIYFVCRIQVLMLRASQINLNKTKSRKTSKK